MGSGSSSSPPACPWPAFSSGSALSPGADEHFWHARQSRRPLSLLLRFLAFLGFLALGAWLTTALREPTCSELDVVASSLTAPPRVWTPSRPADPSLLATIDLRLVHEQLLPAWFMALQRDPYSTGRDTEERSFASLRNEAGKDPNLDEILVTLRDWATMDPSLYSKQVDASIRGWNQYLEQNGLPWYLAYHLEAGARGGRLFVRSYRVVADLRASVSGDLHRVRVVSRADHTNLGELFFGQSSDAQDGAIVVADRIMDFAMDRLWMPMDPGNDGSLPPMDREFAPALRAQAALSLSAQAIQCLQAGATTRRAIEERMGDIAGRKKCGRSLELGTLPWNGLTDRGRRLVRDAAAFNAQRGCKRLTGPDAAFLLEASDRLAGSACLRESLGALGAWMARAVAVHEVRHLEDDLHAPKGERTPRCNGCPEGSGATTRAEISAYLGSMATPGLGLLALFQACGLDTTRGDAATDALHFVLPRVATLGCTDGPPAALNATAQSVERSLFGRSDAIELPRNFPAVLPFPWHRDSHVAAR